jgi:hypothetical protein
LRLAPGSVAPPCGGKSTSQPDLWPDLHAWGGGCRVAVPSPAVALPSPPVTATISPPAASSSSPSSPLRLIVSRADTAQMAHRASCRASGRPSPKKWPWASAGLRVQPIVPARHEHEGHRAASGWAASCLGRVRLGRAGLGGPNGHLYVGARVIRTGMTVKLAEQKQELNSAILKVIEKDGTIGRLSEQLQSKRRALTPSPPFPQTCHNLSFCSSFRDQDRAGAVADGLRVGRDRLEPSSGCTAQVEGHPLEGHRGHSQARKSDEHGYDRARCVAWTSDA